MIKFKKSRTNKTQINDETNKLWKDDDGWRGIDLPWVLMGRIDQMKIMECFTISELHQELESHDCLRRTQKTGGVSYSQGLNRLNEIQNTSSYDNLAL